MKDSRSLKKYFISASILVIGIYGIIWTTYMWSFRNEVGEYESKNELSKKVELESHAADTNLSVNFNTLKKKTQTLQEINEEIKEEHAQKNSELKEEIPVLNSDIIHFRKVLSALEESDEVDKKDFIDIELIKTTELEETYNKFEDCNDEIEKQKSKIETFSDENKEISNPLWINTEKDLEQLISNMNPEEKAAQLVMFAAKGQSTTQSYKDHLEETRPGGLILMGSNISSEYQTKKFTNQIQQTNSEIPLLIATDQEGGVVRRVTWDPTPSQKTWGIKDRLEICDLAKTRSEILFKSGINTNFAPLVDLTYPGTAFINNRTISDNPKKVSELSQAFVDCTQDKNVFATLKHFPGHGSTVEDSHFTLPSMTKSKDEWLESDAIPFKEIQNSKLIMVGHLKFSDLDPEEPASQSEVLIEDILRGELNYDGVIVTDAMGQLHGSTGITPEEALPKVFNSGIDIALYVSLPNSEERIIEIIAEGIESREIDNDKVEDSLMRILKLKREIFFAE